MRLAADKSTPSDKAQAHLCAHLQGGSAQRGLDLVHWCCQAAGVPAAAGLAFELLDILLDSSFPVEDQRMLRRVGVPKVSAAYLQAGISSSLGGLRSPGTALELRPGDHLVFRSARQPIDPQRALRTVLRLARVQFPRCSMALPPLLPPALELLLVFHP